MSQKKLEAIAPLKDAVASVTAPGLLMALMANFVIPYLIAKGHSLATQDSIKVPGAPTRLIERGFSAGFAHLMEGGFKFAMDGFLAPPYKRLGEAVSFFSNNDNEQYKLNEVDKKYLNTHSNIVDVINRVERGESPGDLEFRPLQPSTTLQGSHNATPVSSQQVNEVYI